MRRNGYWMVACLLLNACIGGPPPDSDVASSQQAFTVSGRPPSRLESVDYLGNYPSNKRADWSRKIQGVAATRSHWYFTQNTAITKVPIGMDLNCSKVCGAKRAERPSSLKPYNHYGDADVHDGKLYVPLEHDPPFGIFGQESEPPVLAVFDADTLELITVTEFPAQDASYEQNRAGWVAIDPVHGHLYTSNNRVDDDDNPVFIYKMRWSGDSLRLYWHDAFFPRDENGNALKLKPYMQGGDFSEDGSVLYLANGKKDDFDNRDGGIWAFDVNTGRKITKSTQDGRFKYEFHPGLKDEEVEGLVVVDLDDGRAPGIGGQLHAVLLNFDRGRYWFKHYRVNETPRPQRTPPSPGTLSVTSFRAEASATQPGRILVRYTVRNTGAGPLPSWDRSFYLCPSKNFLTCKGNPAWSRVDQGPGLEASRVYSEAFPIRADNVEPGQYYVHMVTKYRSGRSSRASARVSDAVTVPNPDVAADYVRVGTVAAGASQVTVDYAVRNAGGKAGRVQARLWAMPPGGGREDRRLLGSGTLAELRAGESVERSGSFSIASLPSGEWHVVLEVSTAGDTNFWNNHRWSSESFHKRAPVLAFPPLRLRLQ